MMLPIVVLVLSVLVAASKEGGQGRGRWGGRLGAGGDEG